MKNAIVKTEQSTEVTNPLPQQESFMEGFSANDLVFPKLWLMQQMSEFVTDGKAKFGDFVDSMTGMVLSSMEKGVDIIPIHFKKLYYILKQDAADGKFKFDHVEDCKVENLPWNYVDENGTQMKRDLVRVFYVLIPEVSETPFVVSFRGTSAFTGKNIASQMVFNSQQKNMPHPFSNAYAKINLFGYKDKNDFGTFCVFKHKVVGKASKEEIEKAYFWYGLVKSISSAQLVDEQNADSAKVEAAPIPKDADGKDIF